VGQLFVEDFEDGKLDQWGISEKGRRQKTRMPETAGGCQGRRAGGTSSAGPLLHVFVDDQPMFTRTIPPGEGRIGIYAHGRGEAYYDNLRIDTQVDPVNYLSVEPQAADGSLVFEPHENAKLQFKVSNHSDAQQRVTVAASVKQWGGDVVRGETTQEIATNAGEHRTAEFDMGRIPAGFYRIDLQASCAEQQVCALSDLPLA
jgi:hypothetical protein